MTPGNDWLEQARLLVAGLGQSLAAAAPSARAEDPAHDPAEHAADCRWCPLCQAAAAFRGERPDLVTALADTLGAAAAALRTLAEPPAAPTAAPDEADPPAAAPPSAAGGSAVQRIEIA